MLLFSLGISHASAGVIGNIPLNSQVILDSSKSSAIEWEETPEGTWMPTPEQARESLSAIQTYLEASSDEKNVTAVIGVNREERRTWIASEIRKILANKDGYRVQFWGVVKNKQRIIICNFFPAIGSGEKDEFPMWREQEVSVADGGYYFWQVAYDPTSKKIINFESNGYAWNEINTVASLPI